MNPRCPGFFSPAHVWKLRDGLNESPMAKNLAQFMEAPAQRRQGNAAIAALLCASKTRLTTRVHGHGRATSAKSVRSPKPAHAGTVPPKSHRIPESPVYKGEPQDRPAATRSPQAGQVSAGRQDAP